MFSMEFFVTSLVVVLIPGTGVILYGLDGAGPALASQYGGCHWLHHRNRAAICPPVS